ncbi:hypothetical protein H257_16202 [Aphanomyces astaci]|uniref:Uncharacterized protein n=1 Tax=Aphanomyces astaci TaxID=112090 RepID=W4FLQ4_APHAT|nr:hypothetical protein H257_16202 [Aphanomyces astaci]ETV67603.1 hypothetical protein H257_16202 [Aphanomyces astaci]|eukprot:XP_009842860.1 hypothetical protein H257_16202 [Aphanomyces astaci]
MTWQFQMCPFHKSEKYRYTTNALVTWLRSSMTDTLPPSVLGAPPRTPPLLTRQQATDTSLPAEWFRWLPPSWQQHHRHFIMLPEATKMQRPSGGSRP